MFVVDLQDRTVSITVITGLPWPIPTTGCRSPPDRHDLPPVSNQHGSEVEVRYINANDGTVEGLDVIGKPCFTVSSIPSVPGPRSAAPLFLPSCHD